MYARRQLQFVAEGITSQYFELPPFLVITVRESQLPYSVNAARNEREMHENGAPEEIRTQHHNRLAECRRELAVALDRQRLFRCGVQAHRTKPLNRYPTGYPAGTCRVLANDFVR